MTEATAALRLEAVVPQVEAEPEVAVAVDWEAPAGQVTQRPVMVAEARVARAAVKLEVSAEERVMRRLRFALPALTRHATTTRPSRLCTATALTTARAFAKTTQRRSLPAVDVSESRG